MNSPIFDVPGKFAVFIEHDGSSGMVVLPVSDLRTPDGCERLLRLIMAAVNIDPDTLENQT